MIKKKIEWQGGLLNSPAEIPILIKNQTTKNLIPEEAGKISGKVCLRIEKKGRGRSPVVILFKFSDTEAKKIASLKKLCSELKTKLACGGTVEEGEILLTLQDVEKVKKTLLLSFGIQS